MSKLSKLFYIIHASNSFSWRRQDIWTRGRRRSSPLGSSTPGASSPSKIPEHPPTSPLKISNSLLLQLLTFKIFNNQPLSPLTFKMLNNQPLPLLTLKILNHQPHPLLTFKIQTSTLHHLLLPWSSCMVVLAAGSQD